MRVGGRAHGRRPTLQTCDHGPNKFLRLESLPRALHAQELGQMCWVLERPKSGPQIAAQHPRRASCATLRRCYTGSQPRWRICVALTLNHPSGSQLAPCQNDMPRSATEKSKASDRPIVRSFSLSCSLRQHWATTTFRLLAPPPSSSVSLSLCPARKHTQPHSQATIMK